MQIGGQGVNSITLQWSDNDKAPEIADLEILFEENIYMKSNIKDGDSLERTMGENLDCGPVPIRSIKKSFGPENLKVDCAAWDEKQTAPTKEAELQVTLSAAAGQERDQKFYF